MTRLQVALLNASDHPTTVRNFRRELDGDLVEFDARERVPETHEFDAAVVTGSRASVYWNEPWIAALKEWCRGAIATGMPMLGVCYGHQLLADVLGGTVEDMGEYEIGYREVTHDVGSDDSAGSHDVDKVDPLFAGIDDSMTVFTTHSDTVTELPPDAERLAENDYGIHAFRVEHVFGVQFHPEYDTETAEVVTRDKDLPDERIESVLDGITEANYRRACEAKALFGNFCAYARDVRDREASTADAPTAAGDD